jgi:hypothetical protein
VDDQKVGFPDQWAVAARVGNVKFDFDQFKFTEGGATIKWKF